MTIRTTNIQDLYSLRYNDYSTNCYIVCYIAREDVDDVHIPDTIIVKHLIYETFPQRRFAFGSWRPFFVFKEMSPRHLSWDAGRQYYWLKENVLGL